MLVRPHDRRIDCMFFVGRRPRLASVSKAASHTRSPTVLWEMTDT